MKYSLRKKSKVFNPSLLKTFLLWGGMGSFLILTYLLAFPLLMFIISIEDEGKGIWYLIMDVRESVMFYLVVMLIAGAMGLFYIVMVLLGSLRQKIVISETELIVHGFIFKKNIPLHTIRSCVYSPGGREGIGAIHIYVEDKKLPQRFGVQCYSMKFIQEIVNILS